MKKKLAILFLIVILAFIFLKLGKPKKDDYLVKINNYTISLQEFNDEFKGSAYAKENTPESRREFLNSLIRKKLVLQDAQARGLDRDPEFLKSIERFWEQSLLKRSIDEKAREIMGSFSIKDNVVEEVYNKLKTEGKADKPYQEMYQQIRWSLVQVYESREINKWLTSLYKKADIKVNEAYILKKPKENTPVLSNAGKQGNVITKKNK